MRLPVCAYARPPASTVAPAKPSKVERVKVMSCQWDLEVLSGGADLDRTSIECHAGGLGNPRYGEGFGEVGPFLRWFECGADLAVPVPWPIFDPQQPDLAVGADLHTVARAERESLRIGQRVVAHHRATDRIGDQIGFASPFGDQN